MKKSSLLLIFALAALLSFSGCGNSSAGADNTLTVLNYGQYLDPQTIKDFEKETGITIKYEEYITPENMYTKYKAGSIDYDLICTSDYMIEKLITEGEVIELNLANIPAAKNIASTYYEFSKSFDPENKYTIPYFFGTVGILYNKTMVNQSDLTSWDCLWNEKYSGQIIMTDSVRDAFMVPLKYLGYSLNTTKEDELKQAQEILLQQKPLVQSYLVDNAQEEMIAENAAMALVYSGEAAYAQRNNENLSFIVPDEGSNMWIDSWFLPKTCKNKENAEKFLDFLCQQEAANQSFEYVYYATPNQLLFNSLDENTKADATIFPSAETLDNCEVYHSLNEESTTLYNALWKEVKSTN
jgi:spermidine/putrescine transport system substrate-binding protein/spermidine/putrescine transport system permease protein